MLSDVITAHPIRNLSNDCHLASDRISHAISQNGESLPVDQ